MNRPFSFGLLSRRPAVLIGAVLLLAAVFVGTNVWSAGTAAAPAAPPVDAPAGESLDLSKQTDEQAAAKSVGCMECHQETPTTRTERRRFTSAAPTATAATPTAMT